MYPNPQDAVLLPPRPNLEQYKKLAKDLVKACRSGDPGAIRAWAARWMESLSALHREAGVTPRIHSRTDDIEQFAQRMLTAADEPSARCRLADAQFVIARAHGFLSWPKLAAHIESLANANSPSSAFETAADAIITGAVTTLDQLLREHPDLVRARSAREHRATLLHYVSANGVEGDRQVSPKNAAHLTRMLLDAGADVDATADVYGGACTTLGLVATSAPPAIAGVQIRIIDVLLEYGAKMDIEGSAGHRHSLVRACLANGQPEAATHLVDRGAPLDLPGAAGVGRFDVVKRFFDDAGTLKGATDSDLRDGFALACAYGRTPVVDFLSQRTIAVDTELTFHGAGHTGLHVAAYHANVDTVRILLQHGASVDVIDKTWKTPPLYWALAGWRNKAGDDAKRYFNVVAQLVAAGSAVPRDVLEWDWVRADPAMLAALTHTSK
jgi:ankyrin repeat protein